LSDFGALEIIDALLGSFEGAIAWLQERKLMNKLLIITAGLLLTIGAETALAAGIPHGSFSAG